MDQIVSASPSVGTGLWAHLRDMLSRINILGVVTLLQGLLTMGLSWMIFLRSETAQLTANDLQSKLLLKISMDAIVRLKTFRQRILDVGDKNQVFAQATMGMLADIDTSIIDQESIRDYCADMQNHTYMERWRNSKQIAIELHEKEARAKDPSHMLNLTLSAVFALMEKTGAKPLVDV